MAPGSLHSLPVQERQTLLAVARSSIQHGLRQGAPLAVVLDHYPASLRVKRATFVTLHRDHQLRGCIGTLEAIRPLVEDVAHNAYAAAFADPRFPPVSETELDSLQLEISVLSPSQPMNFDSEEDLIRQLRPGIDGLILEEKGHRGTFLPSVWESLPDPKRFLQHLKLKAGLSPDYWSDTVRVERYTTESFSE